jgi:AcrR family transcriptional regulator
MNAPKTARQRARAELTKEITDAARLRLAAEGAAALSLRAVARDLGMVSSAVYRYFASRDELLTALLLDAYNAVGEQAEHADATARNDSASPVQRWTAVWHGVRAWALAHQHEFALLYGTPVPGYAAPADTTVAAARMPLTLMSIVNDTAKSGELAQSGGPSAAAGLVADTVRDTAHPDVTAETLNRVLMAWSQLIGTIGFELFGHFNGVVTDNDAYFTHVAHRCALDVGLPGSAD